MLSLQGPLAAEITQKVLSLGVNALPRNHLLWWRDIIISRTGYTGSDGLEFIVAKKEAEKVWLGFLAAGALPCGLGARDTLRLEAGLPLYGHEYDEDASPLETGYGWAVKFDKGDFIGRESLLKQKELGLKKKLVGLSLSGRAIPREGCLVFSSDGTQNLGRVTSGTFSPTFKRPLALAYLVPEFTALETTVAIEIRGNKVPAKVVAKTFYKR
jgi:aminomethyltransferase